CSPWGCCGGWARPGWRSPVTSPSSATTTSSSPPTPPSRSPRCASPSTSSAGPPPSSCSTRPTGPTSTSTAASYSSPNWSRGPAAAHPPAHRKRQWWRLPAPHPQAHSDHRQRELALRGLRLAAQEVADPGEEPGPFGLLHDQKMGVRADGGQQGIGGTGLAVPELAHLGRGEQVRSLPEQLLLPGLGRAATPRGQRDAGLTLAHLGQPGDPADPVVIHVPQASEHAARPEHPGDLG